MEMEFVLRDQHGRIDVTTEPNSDPSSLGCDLLVPGLGPEYFLGFPVCTATVTYRGVGYRALFGWLQLVRSTDNASGGAAYEIDPVALYQDLPTPFCWFGITPTLFDAPFRFKDRQLEWDAHSVLCFVPSAAIGREVKAIAAFAWGFDVRDGDVRLRDPRPLVVDDWDQHVGYLSDRFPEWQFASGWHDG